ncbi:CRP/FNR family transcriptional regulator, anaerobic regulatory protein [Thermosulfidibacter takaii ABI70S6]|uniref:CRP/FNR family transcriptional regulator, anaerobic regulatory protein n=1 Tax=Thermosulfidibacter takaii (strain DSM 17441 / JCM 13301 / NBRC 103674 / ABI70S6) TaxID=1298851 RepID=A0A0S3QUJ5_THET7|nr:cyclic nucleotide-binding domain-containing protein [Thermosulfidibacter takaii]BAT72005.1 CRP/FNR family transcriptional regulator, anaerobic regulatory protein [Thermosulfidibacter takaii ABI70S6]
MIEKLKKNPLFCGFSPEEIETFTRYTQAKEYSKDTDVIKKGDTSSEMFIFLEGQAKVIRKVVMPIRGKTFTGKDKSLAIITPEKTGFFGEMSLLTGDPRSATITTITSCKFMILDREAFYRLFDEQPRIASKLLLNISKVLCHRVEDLNRKVVKLTTALSAVLYFKKET